MSRCLRIFWLLLCLVLAARGSAAAILPITDARRHNHPVAEGAALIEQAPLVGLHDETATDRSSNDSLPQPHHHSCHQLCKMLVAVVTAPLSVPASNHTSAPVPAPQGFSSVIASPPVPPPRVRPRADQSVCL
jgi:hypothetical protein